MANVHVKHLEKGDSLIKEGEASASMYWVQSGSLRLFKKKGEGFIELGVVHAGEVIGELSFLDKQTRSASVEALQSCQVVEIPRGNFDKVVDGLPNWLTSLIQTLVKRLRTTNNRLREVESNSTVYHQDEDGKTTKHHEFLSIREIMKLCSALILVAARNAEAQADGSLKLRAGWMQVQAGHVLGVQVAKIQSFLDVLQDVFFIRIDKQKDHVDIYVIEMDLLERFMYWLNEDNSKPEDKKIKISMRAMAICDAINEYGNLESAGEATSLKINMAEIFEKAAAASKEKMPFEFNYFGELIKAGFADEIRMASEKEKYTNLALQSFLKNYPMLVLRSRFDLLNAQKRGDIEDV